MEGWKLQKKGEFIEIFNDENVLWCYFAAKF